MWWREVGRSSVPCWILGKLVLACVVVFHVSACVDRAEDPVSPGEQPAIGAIAADGVVAPQAFTPVFTMALGGSGSDEMIRDVTSDAQGNIYITGGTNSANFPVTPGAFDVTFNNPGSPVQDAFVAKLSPTGQLIWATYIGGPGYDRAYAIEVDAQGFVYVAGRAGRGLPVTANAMQRTFAGGNAGSYGEQDGFVCKLQPNGAALVFCTYFGNIDPGVIRDIALDANANVYLVTSAAVGTFPSAWFTGRYQPVRRGARDALVAKLDVTGSRIIWATYLGGTGEELNTNTVRLDGSGNVFVLINTRSTNAATPNGFDHTLGGVSDLYLAKLSPDGARLLYGTYVGGSAYEGTETHQLWVTPAGEAVVTGTTTSVDFPTSAGAYQRAFGGAGGSGTGAGTNYSGDGFITRVTPAGLLRASTYLGRGQGEGIEGVGVDVNGVIYVAGSTYSPAFPHTVPVIGPGGNADLFAAVLSADLSTLLYAVRIGGSGEDTNRSAFVNAAGTRFMLGGIAGSSDFPIRNASIALRGAGRNGALVDISRGN